MKPTEAMMSKLLLTSEAWQLIYPYPKVLDPDGWDRQNYQYSWNEERITYEEYFNRISKSTVIGKITNGGDHE
jgi:hypothetical protein